MPNLTAMIDSCVYGRFRLQRDAFPSLDTRLALHDQSDLPSFSDSIYSEVSRLESPRWKDVHLYVWG